MPEKRKESLWIDLSLVAVALVIVTAAVLRLRGDRQASSERLIIPQDTTVRELASQPVIETKAAPTSFDLGCLHTPEEKIFVTNSPFARFTARACKPATDVKLLSSGDPVIIFEREKRIVSSYVGLAGGTNTFEFSWKGGKRSVRVQRNLKTY